MSSSQPSSPISSSDNDNDHPAPEGTRGSSWKDTTCGKHSWALTSNRYYQVLISGAPDLAPFPWVCVNLGCLLWSVLLIFAIQQTEGPLERVYGTQLYLTWNLVTTVIWCVEIGLIVMYRRSQSTWIHWIELVAAAYFFQDSIRLYQQVLALEPDEDIQGELLDAVVNSFAYLYQFVDSVYLLSQGEARGGTLESLSDALIRGNCDNTSEENGYV